MDRNKYRFLKEAFGNDILKEEVSYKGMQVLNEGDGDIEKIKRHIRLSFSVLNVCKNIVDDIANTYWDAIKKAVGESSTTNQFSDKAKKRGEQ